MVNSTLTVGVLNSVGDVVAISAAGFGGVGLGLSGTITGTIVFEGTFDNGTWFALPLTPVTTNGSPVTSATAAGQWRGSLVGLASARARMTAGVGPCGVQLFVEAPSFTPPALGGSGGTSSTFGDAFPSTGTAAGFIDSSGNMAGGNLDASGNLKVAGTLTTTPPAAGTGAQSSVAISASSFTVLASNASRLGFIIYNDSSTSVDILFTTDVASSTVFSLRMLPNDRISTADLGVNWTGIIKGIGDSATGSLRVTELTA